MARRAVVLFNLGGPDRPQAVEPFLFNLFNDRAIIDLPWPLRWGAAKLISKRRAPVAQKIYAELGGASPLLPLTQRQAAALEAHLTRKGLEAKVFIAMRYWHPMSGETVARVKEYDPDMIHLLPLYPQFSTTSTASSLKDWHRAAARAGLNAPTTWTCCYPDRAGWVKAVANVTANMLNKSGRDRTRILFSAHGLPKKIVAAGDPYAWQVEQTAKAVAGQLAALGVSADDWRVCYQSKVGPLAWIGPSLDAELARAGKDGVAVIVVPIAFVSEHSETLVELDIEYKKMAQALGVPDYLRAPAVGTEPDFIAALAGLVEEGGAPGRTCPHEWNKCPHSGGNLS